MMRAALRFLQWLPRLKGWTLSRPSREFEKYKVAPRLRTEEVRRRLARGLWDAWPEHTGETRL